MKTVLRVLKWFGVAIVCLFVGLQFVRPARTNPPVDPSQTIEARLQVPPHVASILDRSCKDCHSNATRWPWYSNVAPFSWLLVDHVIEGRDNLNLSEWGHLDNRRVDDKLEEICDEVKIGAMPIDSYTWIHRSAKLSQEDVKTLCEWANAERVRMGQR
ncbi:MAG TPA: heme-binding domain-containing protein [Pyrinomonadaceae bacterium]|nr:heme-binding domain-containing protein [Pyrinomonadaceae bacterium]